MSFSSDIKEEVSKINNLKNIDIVKAELTGYLMTNNCSILKNKVRYSTENKYNINRLNKLLGKFNVDYHIEMQGNLYVITFKIIKQMDWVVIKDGEFLIDATKIDINMYENEEILKSIVRGGFLGAGSINNPDKKYHLEIAFSNIENAIFLKHIVSFYGIEAKELKRQKSYCLYIKEGEEISKFLAIIGAFSGVLKFEEIRVLKEMKNNVNRLVNCETANLSKTVHSSVRQMECIKIIKKSGKFKDLPESLQEIANLRMENPDATLQELGNMLRDVIGKSGVNHRFEKIEEYARNLKK